MVEAEERAGGMHQNLKAHGTRHNQPLKKLLNMFRAVYGRSVRMEDKTHGVYSPGVQPDLTYFKGAKDGTHHVLYELKIVNLCSSDDAPARSGGALPSATPPMASTTTFSASRPPPAPIASRARTTRRCAKGTP